MIPYILTYVIVFALDFFFLYGILYSTDFPDLLVEYNWDEYRLESLYTPRFSFPLTEDSANAAFALIRLHQRFAELVSTYRQLQARNHDSSLANLFICVFRVLSFGIGIPLCVSPSIFWGNQVNRIVFIAAPPLLGISSYLLARKIYKKRETFYRFDKKEVSDYSKEFAFSAERGCQEYLNSAGVKPSPFYYNAFFYYIEKRYTELIDLLLPKIYERKKINIALRALTLPISIYFLFKFQDYFPR